MHTISHVSYFAKKEGQQEAIVLADQKDILSSVQDCPLAVELANKSNKEIRKSIRKKHDYLNQVIMIYNNDCRPLEAGTVTTNHRK